MSDFKKSMGRKASIKGWWNECMHYLDFSGYVLSGENELPEEINREAALAVFGTSPAVAQKRINSPYNNATGKRYRRLYHTTMYAWLQLAEHRPVTWHFLVDGLYYRADKDMRLEERRQSKLKEPF